MAHDGKLQVEFFDIYGKRLAEEIVVTLYHQGLSERLVTRIPASRKAIISKLSGPPNGLYRMECDPPSYLPFSRFVQASRNVRELSLTCIVDQKKMGRPAFPPFSRVLAGARDLLMRSAGVLGFVSKSGQGLYDGLDDIRKAGLLNIVAKCNRTRFENDRSVLTFFTELLEIRGDRFFVKTVKELREETKNSVAAGLFSEASGVLHRPPDGFTSAGSYKTQDQYGNLQLTFFTNGIDWLADVDIDDANGLQHVFQVLRNNLTGRPTNPYDIHQILFKHQELDSGFRLLV